MAVNSQHFANQRNRFYIEPPVFTIVAIKGTVQRKLTGVLSGINRMLMICSSVAWYFYLNLKSLGPLNFKKHFLAA
jgi:hypothetical protein